MTDPPDFDAWYARDLDPFGVRTRWYERRKVAVLLAALRRERYSSAWDPACGTGDLALALTGRTAQVVASDLSPRAVEISRALTRGRAGVRVVQHALPAPLPPAALSDQGDLAVGPFELLVISEVLYYLARAERRATVDTLDRAAVRDAPAELVSVHWRYHPEDGQLSGAAVTAELAGDLAGRGWTRHVQHDDTDFVLAGWHRGTQEGT